jgi:hypothetical protein
VEAKAEKAAAAAAATRKVGSPEPQPAKKKKGKWCAEVVSGFDGLRRSKLEIQFGNIK